MTDKKWERIYNDEDETIIWRYDTKKNKYGPYEVEVKSKIPVVRKSIKIKTNV